MFFINFVTVMILLRLFYLIGFTIQVYTKSLPNVPKDFVSYIIFNASAITLTYLCCNYSCVRPLPTTLLTL